MKCILGNRPSERAVEELEIHQLPEEKTDVTDLAIFEPDPTTREMTVTSIHPGMTREQIAANTGWPVRFGAEVTETFAPTAQELAVLRDLHARTARAHASAA